MNVVDEKLKYIEPYLQKHVIFSIGNKSVRKGRLLLYNIKDYYIKFIIKTNKNINKTYEIPYPYDIIPEEERVRLTYRLKDLCMGNEKKIKYLEEYCSECNNKLFDSTIIISNIDAI